MAKRSMGELERAVMDILWDRGGWLTPGEVHALLQDPPLAYTTVMTILVRLWRKARVERQRDGRAYAYHPVVTRAQYVAARMEEVLAEARDRAAVLSHFLDGMDPADRAQLRRLLNQLPVIMTLLLLASALGLLALPGCARPLGRRLPRPNGPSCASGCRWSAALRWRLGWSWSADRPRCVWPA